MANDRRGFKEGSLKQQPTGKWQARVLLNGKRISQSFPTKTEALAWIRKQHTDADKGLLPPDDRKVTVGAFLTTWLDAVRPNVKPKTHQGYRGVIGRHIAPRLGDRKLAELRPDHVQALYAEKLKGGLSPRTVQIIHAVLHRALADAVKWGRMARNVCDAATIPRAPRKEIKVWTPEQARYFLLGIDGDRREALYRVALSCGLRLGELLGLKWEDIDLQAGRLQVRRTLQRLGKGEGIGIGEPKTAKGRRQIVLAPQVAEALRKWRIRQLEERLFAGKKWKETGHVFTSLVGTPLESRRLQRHFEESTARLELPKIRFHDLRHTCATLLLTQGVHPKVVQEMLGHSQIAVTMDIYSHVLPTMQEEAARIMERMLG